jgi:hypothetical protein
MRIFTASVARVASILLPLAVIAAGCGDSEETKPTTTSTGTGTGGAGDRCCENSHG